MCDQILLLHLGPSCKDFTGTIFWTQWNLGLILGFSFHFPAPYNRTNCFESDLLAWSVLCFMGSEWLQDHGWAFLQMMTKYMDSPRNVFSLGQHCYIAGLLPYEEACQLVQIIKERLGSWYDCTKTWWSKASNTLDKWPFSTELLLEITYMKFYLNWEQISFIIKSFGKFFEYLLNSHMRGVNNQVANTQTHPFMLCQGECLWVSTKLCSDEMPADRHNRTSFHSQKSFQTFN